MEKKLNPGLREQLFEHLFEYAKSAELLYASLGQVVHNGTGESVAFTTSKTVDCMARFHAAFNGMMRFAMAHGAPLPKEFVEKMNKEPTA